MMVTPEAATSARDEPGPRWPRPLKHEPRNVSAEEQPHRGSELNFDLCGVKCGGIKRCATRR